MKCDRAQQLISLELDDQISAGETVLLRQHVEGCPECSAFRHDLRRIVAASRQLQNDRAPDGFALAVNRRIVAAGQADATRHWLPLGDLVRRLAPPPTGRLLLSLAVACAGLILIFAGVRHYRSAGDASTEIVRFVDAAASEEIVLAANNPLDDISMIRLAGAAGADTDEFHEKPDVDQP